VLKRLVQILVFLVLVAVFAVGGGNALWQGTTNTLVRALKGLGAPPPSDVDYATLPAPVARYLRHTVVPGQAPVRIAEFTQEGELFLNGTWRPMHATQIVTTAMPNFVWDAQIEMAPLPLATVLVRDSYILGRASMRARLLAVRTVADASNSPALDAGSLMRYLGEAVWIPSRLLPGNGLTWEGVDDHQAIATLVDHDTNVSLRFTVNDEGDITQIDSPARFREVNGRYVQTPWRVRALGYETVNGVRVMSPAEAEWTLPEGPQPYWRARLTHVAYSY
jgi:hypothetical protein